MDTTKETNNQENEFQQEDGRRYERVPRFTNNYNRENAPEGHRQRPRIARRTGVRDETVSPQSPYETPVRRSQNQQETYRPYNNSRSYQPRANYQPRNNYRQHPSNSYQQTRQDNDLQPRWQQNTRQRINQGNEYQQYGQNGYRSRTNQEGHDGNYQPRYQNVRRPQGGYRPSGYAGENQQEAYRRQRPFTHNPNAKYNQKKRIEYREQNIDPNEPIRLNKFLANAGVCSRREADDFIQAGVVTVNGQVVTELGTKVLRTDNVVFHEQPVKLEKKVYVLLNKPKDCVTTSDDPQHRKTVMDLVKGACPERIYPVGRLDRNTTGVLLLTNDGELASKLTHPQFVKKKIYHVFLDRNITAADLQKIAEGIELDDGNIRADAVEYASPTDKRQVGIEIHSGRNRIVRRIFEKLGYHVIKLDRVQFCGLTKKNVRRGDWRFLTEKEVDMLRMGAFE